MLSLYRAGSLTAGVRELARFDFVGKQKVRWDKEGTVKAESCIFSYDKGTKISWERYFCTPQNNICS
jgi:hypothetical protein